MLNLLKNTAIKILESHPYGYAIGLSLVTRLNFLLPHESDYWGFRKLAKNRPDGLFLDLGANQGHSAKGFNKVVSGWKLFSVEANPAHIFSLTKLKNSLINFDFKIAAIDSEGGKELSFFIPYYGKIALHSSAATTLNEAKKGVKASFHRQEKHVHYVQGKVKSVTIDELNLAPNIIKLDIQGKELEAFDGGRETLDKYSPDLLVEVLFNHLAVISKLAKLGYSPYAYIQKLDSFVKFDKKELEPGVRNLFFSRRNLETI